MHKKTRKDLIFVSFNIISAIINIINNQQFMTSRTASTIVNRANNMGEALEEYIKDAFAGTFGETNLQDRNLAFAEVFSYQGGANTPPDGIIRNGDAFEVKKIQSSAASLALNSSYPKQKLFSDSSMISRSCRQAEIDSEGNPSWKEKDIIYIVGSISDKKIKSLAFVYGTEYCAERNVYENLLYEIKNNIALTPDIPFEESTTELAHANSIDPLKITYFRCRGMWGIKNPLKVFDYIYTQDIEKGFSLMAIINCEKYKSFPNTRELEELAEKTSSLKIENKKVKCPDNPSVFIDVKLITYSK